MPTLVPSAEITRRFTPAGIGGIGSYGLEVLGYHRLSTANGRDGRDVARLSGFVDWRRDTLLPGGILLAFEGALQGDLYDTVQDSAFEGTRSRIAPDLGVELRYPMARHDGGDVTHLIEPVLQLTWSDLSGDLVPVEDSLIVEFDEGNLLALDRFPGQDQRETGLRANLGIGYTRTAPLGWSLGLAAGVVLRQTEEGQFTPGSGLDGVRSDYLLAVHLTQGDRLQILNRSLFEPGFDFTSSELALNWRGEDHLLATSYTWLAADPAEGRPLDIGEWALETEYQIDSGWLASANWRFDTVANAPTRAGLAVGYTNECIDMEFSVERRYTASASLTPATEFGLTVFLNGFGAERRGRSQARSCLR